MTRESMTTRVMQDVMLIGSMAWFVVEAWILFTR
mgnify:CR=1 FL=1